MRYLGHNHSYAVYAMAALFALLIAGGCQSEAANLPEDGQANLAPSPVDTLMIWPTTFVDTFQVIGTAEPLESVHVSADVPGRVLNAYVADGEHVRRGQTLYRIDVEVDQSRIGLLESQVAAAERELARLQRLRDEGLATAQQLDAAETDLENANQNLRQAQVSVARNRVVSPIDGYIANRMVDAGEFANAGAPLAEIIDFDTIVVYAQVPESEIRYVGNVETVDVEFPALEETFEGRVHRIALQATPTTRTYRVEIHVDNSDHHIRVGMRARLRFERQTYEDVLMIPRDSILEGFLGREAMVVTEDDDGELRGRIRSLQVGPGSVTDIVITEGLEAGDRLILRGHRGLVEGVRVQIINEGEQERSGYEQ